LTQTCPATTYDVPNLYAQNAEAFRCRDAEVLLVGPAETGKTYGLLWKLHLCALKYPGASLVILRKTLTSTYSTVLVTFQEKVLGEEPPIIAYGGEKPQWFAYPTGARIWVAGLDKSSRILSAEHDVVYVNQAEELTLDEWETLTTRTTGRAGHMPYSQTIGDANPTYPTHWMYQREGISRFYSWHRDNPTLYDHDADEWTEQGEETRVRLASLTGLRRVRLFEGRAMQAEGAVYDGYSEALHHIDRFDIPADWRRIRTVDFGYTNPFVCQWWAIDHDGRMFMYREIYHTQGLVEDYARDIVRLSEGESIEATVCDHDAEDRATLERHGVPTVPAKKDISPGLQAVASRLSKAGDNRARLFVLRDSLVEEDKALARDYKPTCTAHEFPAYVWPQAKDGKPIKEVPVDVDNHGMDAMRYGVMCVENPIAPNIQIVRSAASLYGSRERPVRGLYGGRR